MAVSMAAVGTVLELLSGERVPEVLQEEQRRSGELRLVGTSLREAKIMGFGLQVYVLSVYASPEELRESSSLCAAAMDSDADGGGEAFLEALYASDAEKVFVLKFLRSVPRWRAIAGFVESLVEVAGMRQSDAELACEHFPSSFPAGREIQLTARPKAQEVDVGGSWLPTGRVTLKCAQLCQALHVVYLSQRAVVRGLAPSVADRRSGLLDLAPAAGGAEAEQTAAAARGGAIADACATVASNGSEETEAPSPLHRSGKLTRSETMRESRALEAQPVPTRSKSLGESALLDESCMPPAPGSSTTASEDARRGKRRALTWAALAGREASERGYRFGDIVRTCRQFGRSGYRLGDVSRALARQLPRPGY
eukprot:TRINITY_DN3178_c0_g4_i5.p1 TRINITY_DN3178_c0_g4~~TRINITY_DN3178_c0_g4_i5.p1  ORF type:complete len:405 (+),score=98.24 TRINITY_DN3178_c0_g4_i5:116-1216(+)